MRFLNSFQWKSAMYTEDRELKSQDRKSWWATAVLIFCVALVARYSFLGYYGIAEPWQAGQGLETHWTAVHWLQEGGALSLESAALTSSTLDTVYTAAIYQVFGPHPAMVRWLQAFFGALAGVFCMFWGGRLLGKRAGVWGAWFLALLPMHTFLTVQITAGLLVSVICTALAWGLCAKVSSAARLWMATAILIGAAIYPLWTTPPNWNLLWTLTPLWAPLFAWAAGQVWDALYALMSGANKHPMPVPRVVV